MSQHRILKITTSYGICQVDMFCHVGRWEKNEESNWHTQNPNKALARGY